MAYPEKTIYPVALGVSIVTIMALLCMLLNIMSQLADNEDDPPVSPAQWCAMHDGTWDRNACTFKEELNVVP